MNELNASILHDVESNVYFQISRDTDVILRVAIYQSLWNNRQMDSIRDGLYDEMVLNYE